VKGKQFRSWRSVGVAEQAARIYAARGADELCILNIGATPSNEGPDFAMVERMTANNFCPVSVGGGVQTVEDVRQLLLAGADKVVINTAVAESKTLLRACADKYGSQAICVSIDYTDGRIATHCGAIIWDSQPFYGVAMQAEGAQHCGAGEILLTSIDRDGMMEGYDLDMIRAVSAAVDIPVIAAGGCGTPQHALEALQAGADAVAIGSMFLFTDHTPSSVAEYLTSKGIVCRT
jgi:cyclase